MIDNNIINGINIYVEQNYPNIEEEKINFEAINLLKNLYSGKNSELTTTMRYIYQHFIINNEFKEIKNVLEKISIIEMKHLDLLGKILTNSGFTPYFGSINEASNFELWNATYVNYDKDLKFFIEKNIDYEEITINSYKNLINLSTNIKINKLFERIIKDEERHIQIFKSILNKMV